MSCTMAVLILRVVCGVTQEWAYRQAVQNLLTQVTEAQATVTAVRNSYVSIVGAGAPTSPYVHAMTTEMHARLQTLLDAVATSLQNRLRADDPSTPQAWGVRRVVPCPVERCAGAVCDDLTQDGGDDVCDV
eukprot:m.212787 g.212787  ORF g.212787 m.212787 type:complete len:131 (-) comp19051_c0_seq2:297-689(-)